MSMNHELTFEIKGADVPADVAAIFFHRRWRAVGVAIDLMDALLRDGDHAAFRVREGVPADAVLACVVPIEEMKTVLFVYEHPSFDKVDPSAGIPAIVPVLDQESQPAPTSATDKLAWLAANCKNGVTVEINYHRDIYLSVREYLDETDFNADLALETDPAIIEQMIATNTVVMVQAYPRTSIGFVAVFHYDVDAALGAVIEAVNNYGKK